MARPQQQTARALTAEEEDAIGAALEDEHVSTESNGTGDGAEKPPPAKPDNGKTLSAKIREEMRLEKERDDNAEELAGFLAGICIPGKKYTYDLFRLKPITFRDEDPMSPTYGRIFITGKDDGKGLFIQHYEDEPQIHELADAHGGREYSIAVKGPNKDDPKRISTVRHKFSIGGNPKTVGSADGGVPFAHSHQAFSPMTSPGSDVATTMIGMVKDVLTQSRQDMKEMLASVQKSSVPVVDPAAERRWQEEQAEKKREHEARLAKEKLDADERREAARIEREERREREKEEREERREEAKRQHDKEMKLMEQQAEQRREDEKRRREDEDKREKRHEELLKEQRQSMEKLVEKITKKEDDPEKRLLNTIQLVDEIRGGKEKEEGALGKALPDIVKSVKELASQAMTRLGPSEQKKSVTTQAKPKEDTVLLTETTESTAAEKTAPASTEPQFEWPSKEAVERWTQEDQIEIGQMFSRNVEAALQAKWEGSEGFRRVWNEMVINFPPKFHAVLIEFPMDTLLSVVESRAAEGSALKSAAGKQMMRWIYKAIKKKKDEATMEEVANKTTPDVTT